MDDTANPAEASAQPHPPRQRRQRSWLLRHWRGELPLGVSYWAIGMLGGNLAQAILLGAARGEVEAASLSLRAVATLQLGALAGVAALQAWINVGIWRSANRHEARGGGAFWAVAAQVMVLVGMLSLAGLCASSGALERWSELVTLARGKDPMPPVQIARGPDGHSLLLMGALGSGSAQLLERALAAAPAVRALHLDSQGGRLFEGKAIAQEVRRHGLDTFVESQCASACTIAFLAGRDRGATADAKIGFHSASLAGVDGSDPEGTEDMLAIYRAAGMPESFLARVRATPHSQMWYPTREELVASHVVTRVSQGGESAVLSMAGVHSAAAYRQLLLSQPLWAAVEAQFPGTLDRAVAAGWSLHERGGADDRVITASREVVTALVPRALAAASGEHLDAYNRLVIDEIDAALALGPESCGRFLDGHLDVAAVLPEPLVARDRALTNAVLTTPPARPRPLPQDAMTEALRAAWLALPAAEQPVVAAPANYRADPRARCTALRDFRLAIEAMPAARRHDALRSIYQAS
jgi:hypothetical protein